MDSVPLGFEDQCRQHIDRFFAAYPHAVEREYVEDELGQLAISRIPLKGQREGWAAGIIFAVATGGYVPKSISGVSNAQFEAITRTSIEWSRQRARQVLEIMEPVPPADDSLTLPPDPRIEKELAQRLHPVWMTRKLIDENKRVWSSAYGVPQSDADTIEIILNLVRFGRVLFEAKVEIRARESRRPMPPFKTDPLDYSI